MHPFENKQLTFFEKLQAEYTSLWNSLGINENQDLSEIVEAAKHSGKQTNLQLTLLNIRQLYKVDSNINPELEEKAKKGKRVIQNSEIERIDNLLLGLLPDYVGIVTIGKYYEYDRHKYSNKYPKTVTIWTEEEVYTYLLGLYDPSKDNIVSPQQ